MRARERARMMHGERAHERALPGSCSCSMFSPFVSVLLRRKLQMYTIYFMYTI